jgi:opacity protein-like surface antigen
MKLRSLLFSLLLVVSAQSSFSQIQQGSILLGGQFAFQVSESEDGFVDLNNQIFLDDTKSTNFTIAPQIGFAVSEKVFIGGAISLNSVNTKGVNFNGFGNNEIEISQRSFAISPFIRNYFSISDKFFIYLQGDASIALGRQKTKYTGRDESEPEKVTALSIGVRPGLSFFVSNKVALEAEFGFLGYSQQKFKQELDFGGGNTRTAESTDKNYGLTLNTATFNFGISLYLGR